MFWIKLFESKMGMSFSDYGVFPRTLSGLKGLFFGQFIHGDWEHLFYNSAPFLLSTMALFFLYPRAAINSFMICFFAPGVLVWLFARPSFHIGLSGVNYALLAFLFVSGLMRRDTRRMAISLLVVFLYGSMIIGLFPVQQGVSFESHIAGSVIGVIVAFIFRKSDPRKKYSWEIEEELRNQNSEEENQII